ncbi:probable transmembrane ascorbate ferrireductase 2 [Helianthus annuus]|uniref:probable transmembrane ascorbate ferrireductase 2 n=1 Tax=Helianthus annuus TaxID=4232 RepID=UPI001653198F|nr:probable transmembrane ascorbate ferrireductase 2 [Helianthus annuus]
MKGKVVPGPELKVAEVVEMILAGAVTCVLTAVDPKFKEPGAAICQFFAQEEKLKLQPGCNAAQTLEAEITGVLNKIRDETGKWGAGFATFWYPRGSRNSKASLLPWHVFFGVYIYVLAVAACATGLLEKATFLQTNNIISRYSAEAMLVNILGVLIVILGGFVILGVISPPSGKGSEDQ